MQQPRNTTTTATLNEATTMKFRVTPRLAIRLLRALRQVFNEANDALAADSDGGTRVTADEVWSIAIVAAESVVDVITDELAPAA